MSEETEWQPVDQAVVDKQFDDYEKRANRKIAKKPPKGRSVWRALPPRKDRPATPFHETWLHYVNDPKTGSLLLVGECPLKTGKGPVCVVCPEAGRVKRMSVDARRAGQEAEAKALEERARKLSAGWHAFMGAIRVDDEKVKDPQPEVLDLPHAIFQKLNRAFRETVAAGGDFTHPETGYLLVMTRTGEGQFDTEYDVVLAKSPSRIQNPAWLKRIPDLLAVAGDLSMDQASSILAGTAGQAELPPDAPRPQLPPAEGTTNAAGQYIPPPAK